MFCEQCGAEMEQDARFCAMCGRQAASEGGFSSREGMPADHPDRRVRALQIGLGVSLLIMLVLGGILASMSRSDKSAVTHSSDVVTPDPGKSQTGGEVASQNRGDLSREKAEAAIRKRLEPALSALREGTMSMKLSVDRTTFDPERDINQASVALNQNLERFEGVHVDLPRRLKEEVITMGYAGKRAADSLGGVPSSYRYYYRISRGRRCGEDCVNQQGVFIDANRQLLTVTGIRVVEETSRIAEFDYKLVPPASAAGPESTRNGEARFALYDDGWHLEKINYYK